MMFVHLKDFKTRYDNYVVTGPCKPREDVSKEPFEYHFHYACSV